VHILLNNGSIYVKPRPKWSTAHSTHVVYTLQQRKCFDFVIFVRLTVTYFTHLRSLNTKTR